MLGATACLEVGGGPGGGSGGGSVFCYVYMPGSFIDIPGLANY